LPFFFFGLPTGNSLEFSMSRYQVYLPADLSVIAFSEGGSFFNRHF
jgi:hypothetical protein